MKPTFSKIPENELLLKLFETDLPVKRVGPLTTGLFWMVSRLKVHMKEGNAAAIERDWESLRSIMDVAVQSGYTGFFDEFCSVWEKLELKPGYSVSLDESGSEERDPKPKYYFCHESKRSPITASLILTIMGYQWENDRPPTRSEILERMGKGEFPIDDSELCRQLKRLGWQEMIPTIDDLAS